MIDCKELVGKAIHCETEEQATELLKIADKQGFRWFSGNALTEFTIFERHKEKTYYYFSGDMKISFGDIISTSSEVIKFNDLKKEKFNKYDVVSYRGHKGFVLGYDKHKRVLVMFKEEWKLLHSAGNYTLTNGFETEDKLPKKCWFYDEESLTLEIPHMAKVKVTTTVESFTGRYVSICDHDLLIERISEVPYTHNGKGFYTFDGINCSEFTKERSNCSWININDVTTIKEEEKEMKAEYEATKKISGDVIIGHNPCTTEFDKFVRDHGFYDEIEWSKEIEDKFEEENGWIEFLVDNDFLKKPSNKIEFEGNKVYCFRWGSTIYKISKFRSDTMFSIFTLSNTLRFASISQEPRKWEDLINHLTKDQGLEIEVFNSISNAIEYYKL